MADDRTRGNDPRAELPEAGAQVRPLVDSEIGQSLANKLVPVVDKIRQLATKFGVRPYRVYLVHVQWSGSEIGAGSPVQISRKEILPTPQVLDMASTTEVLRSFGLTEEGGVMINKISAKFTEDDLLGRTPDLVNPAMPRTSLRNVEFFWEIVENRKSDPAPVPRRYVPNSTPMLSRDRFQWKIALTKQDSNRARDFTFNRAQA